MSARTDLAAALTAVLDPARYAVEPTPDVPRGIERDHIAVRLWQSDLARGTTIRAVELSLVLWVLTPRKEAPDDDLDPALVDVLGALQPLEWVRWTAAARGVMDNDAGTAWHGWRLDLTAGGYITDKE